nr:FadR/GntR family transcriptional regulator [Vibrio agarilyticus]
MELKSRKVYVQVARDIACKILTGEIRPLEKIPSELSLCQMFGISRTALRESMKLLSAKGLIESKPKVGTLVRQRTHWHFLDSQLIEWIQELENVHPFLSQFLGLRKAIEPEACALAAQNATVEQRKQLSVLIQNMSIAAEKHDMDAWTLNDHEFHQTIFVSTANQFYIPLGNILSTLSHQFLAESAQGGRFCLEEHRAIYDAIMAGNADAARRASIELLDDGNQRLSA